MSRKKVPPPAWPPVGVAPLAPAPEEPATDVEVPVPDSWEEPDPVPAPAPTPEATPVLPVNVTVPAVLDMIKVQLSVSAVPTRYLVKKGKLICWRGGMTFMPTGEIIVASSYNGEIGIGWIRDQGVELEPID